MPSFSDHWKEAGCVAGKQHIVPASKRTNSRERIIDAAIDLCCAEGVHRLSLDAVAARAGLSKGGLLYNFASKSALLQAMVARHMDTVADAVERAEGKSAADGRPNAKIRAYLVALRGLLAAEGKPPGGFLAAIAEQPQLLDPVRDHHFRLVRELALASDTPDMAIIGFLASEGIRSLRLFETSPFEDGELVGYLDTLIELLAHVPIAARVSHQPE